MRPEPHVAVTAAAASGTALPPHRRRQERSDARSRMSLSHTLS
jgi:hypothetical protein